VVVVGHDVQHRGNNKEIKRLTLIMSLVKNRRVRNKLPIRLKQRDTPVIPDRD